MQTILFARRTTVLDFGAVVGGKLCLLCANAVLLLVLANRLDLPAYGAFVATIGAQIVLSRVMMAGSESGLLKFRRAAGAQQALVVRSGLRVVEFGVLIGAGAVLFGGPVLDLLMPSWTWWVAVSLVIGASGTALIDYGYTEHVSRAAYARAALVQGGAALARAVVTLTVGILSANRLDLLFLTYAGVMVVAGLMQRARLVRENKAGSVSSEQVQSILGYSAWQGGANTIIALSLHLGSFFLMFFNQKRAAGLFGFGLSMSLGIFALYNALYEFLAAQAVRAESPQRAWAFVQRSLLVASGLALAGIAALPVLGPLLSPLVRREYQGGIFVFEVLGLSMLLLLPQAALEAGCHAFGHPAAILAGWIIRTLSISFISAATLVRGGAAAPQVVVAASYVVGTAASVLVLFLALMWMSRAVRRRVQPLEAECAE